MHCRYIAEIICLYNRISELVKFIAYINNIYKILIVADKYRCNQILLFYLYNIQVYHIKTTMYNLMALIIHDFS